MNYLDAAAQRVKQELAPELRPASRSEDLYRLYGLLVLVRSIDCTLQDVHDAWSTWMAPEQPHHESLVPFADLSAEAQEKDRPYLEAIRRAALSQRL